ILTTSITPNTSRKPQKDLQPTRKQPNKIIMALPAKATILFPAVVKTPVMPARLAQVQWVTTKYTARLLPTSRLRNCVNA
ncbi:MAG: hypothetical protein M3Z48_05895, partial [Lactobacillus sp.]|nr:hypothetical protein [Lactobacillus sp.]